VAQPKHTPGDGISGVRAFGVPSPISERSDDFDVYFVVRKPVVGILAEALAAPM
jgi:hypothetical protein